MFSELRYRGTLVNYYFICKRKLWLFAHNINFESESDLVAIGKLISKTSYERGVKEIDIDGTIVIDWIDFDKKVIHEVKKSDSLSESHRWQVKYYLYYLEENKGLIGFKGEIDYPRLHKKEVVELTDSDRTELRLVIADISRIISSKEIPERIKIPACKLCSYFQFCWV